MFNLPRIFAAPRYPVHSLTVQAALYGGEEPQRGQFEILVRHFFDRFFNNEAVSADGQTKARTLQIAYALALPGLCFAIYLFPPYHYPGGRPYWSQVGDHYFYVLYSMVAVGAATIFAWDLFFPDLLDVFALSSLSIPGRLLFRARIAAIVLFLGLFLLGVNALGTIFFPASADLPSLVRHMIAHLIAVSMGGTFVATFLIAIQGALITLLGERLFRRISLFLQAFTVALLLTILFAYPLTSNFLQILLNTGSRAAYCFPPFWFLGVYEYLLTGSSTPGVFGELARTGCLATGVTIALAVCCYPLAYRAWLRQVVEGASAGRSWGWLSSWVESLLNGTMVRIPQRRGIFHFITQTMLRTSRYRVYLALYGGLGLALVTAAALQMTLDQGRARFALSVDGLRAATPIVAFWTIAGLRGAFVGAADRRVNWIFRVIHGKPGCDESAATRTWVLLCSLVVTLSTVALIAAAAPVDLRGWQNIATQAFVGVSICVLLTDAFFLNVKTIPFTGTPPASSTNLAYVLIQYFGLFPPLVLLTVSLEDWMGKDRGHWLLVAAIVLAAHVEMQRRHRKIVTDYVNLIDIDEDEEEFPQRLGLRY